MLTITSRPSLETGNKWLQLLQKGIQMLTLNLVRERLAAVGVATDPWADIPRVHVSNINTETVRPLRPTEYPVLELTVTIAQTHEPPYPPGMRDVNQGIVGLAPGDFAIIEIQFRIGDEKTINLDWQALRCLDHLVVPFMLWDRVSNATTLASAVPPAYTLPDLSSSERPYPSAIKHIRMPFDQEVVSGYYRDHIEHGEDYFMRTHHGDAQTDMSNDEVEKGTALIRKNLLHESGGNLEAGLDYYRAIGLGDFVEKGLRGIL